MRGAVVVAGLGLAGAACLLPGLGGLTTADGNVPADAGRDADDAGDAGDANDGGGFCALAPQPNLLCSDFDENGALSAWTLTTSTLSELADDPSTFVSPPFSLRTRHAPGADGGADGSVSLQLEIATPVHGFRATFDARIDVDIAAAAPLQEVFQFWPANGSNRGGYVSGDFVEFQSQNAPSATQTPFGVLPLLGKWQTWVVTFTRSPSVSTGSVEVRLDGALAANLPLADTDLGPTIRIVLGPEHLRVSDDWSVAYDNVLITAL